VLQVVVMPAMCRLLCDGNTLFISLASRCFAAAAFFMDLPALQAHYLREGLLPPTEVSDDVNHTEVVFHGVVPGVDLRLHFVHDAVKRIGLPPRWCTLPLPWDPVSLDVHVFDVQQWRKILPYLVFASSSQYLTWHILALAVSRAAVRQDALVTLLKAEGTTPASARAALATYVRKPGMLFGDFLVWQQRSVWQHCARYFCGPAMFWLMITADAPRKTFRSELAAPTTGNHVIAAAVLFLAGVPNPSVVDTRAIEATGVQSAWPARAVVFMWHVDLIAQRNARWGAARAVWAVGSA
jgi:hypothetical protein